MRPKSLASLYPDGSYDGPNRTYDYADALRGEQLNACQFQLRVVEDGVVLKLQPELEPRRENRVTLSASERDRFGHALPDLHFGLSARDQRTVERGRLLLAEQARALGVNPDDAERSLKWRWHPSGTVRLAGEEADGVVDRDLRVFGTENVYVSGAAVFPNSGTANPTGSVIPDPPGTEAELAILFHGEANLRRPFKGPIMAVCHECANRSGGAMLYER